MKRVGEILKIVMYTMGAQMTVCALLDVFHITDFVQSGWFVYEGLLFTVVLVLTCGFSAKKD